MLNIHLGDITEQQEEGIFSEFGCENFLKFQHPILLGILCVEIWRRFCWLAIITSGRYLQILHHLHESFHLQLQYNVVMLSTNITRNLRKYNMLVNLFLCLCLCPPHTKHNLSRSEHLIYVEKTMKMSNLYFNILKHFFILLYQILVMILINPTCKKIIYFGLSHAICTSLHLLAIDKSGKIL